MVRYLSGKVVYTPEFVCAEKHKVSLVNVSESGSQISLKSYITLSAFFLQFFKTHLFGIWPFLGEECVHIALQDRAKIVNKSIEQKCLFVENFKSQKPWA